MITKGIRGAITSEKNDVDSIKAATLELLSEMMKQNDLQISNISHVIFSVTKDLDKAFPARFARLDFGWSDISMMCFNEADIIGAIQKCIRVLIVYNCDQQFVPKFVYLKGAKSLRSL